MTEKTKNVFDEAKEYFLQNVDHVDDLLEALAKAGYGRPKDLPRYRKVIAPDFQKLAVEKRAAELFEMRKTALAQAAHDHKGQFMLEETLDRADAYYEFLKGNYAPKAKITAADLFNQAKALGMAKEISQSEFDALIMGAPNEPVRSARRKEGFGTDLRGPTAEDSAKPWRQK